MTQVGDKKTSNKNIVAYRKIYINFILIINIFILIIVYMILNTKKIYWGIIRLRENLNYYLCQIKN